MYFIPYMLHCTTGYVHCHKALGVTKVVQEWLDCFLLHLETILYVGERHINEGGKEAGRGGEM